MPVDFFTQGQKGTSDKELFGICDDTTIGKKKPAYINDSDAVALDFETAPLDG